jgi:phosphoribosylglycinamide formyltransferase 1
MRVGILTSVEVRHRFFASYLRQRLNATAVLYETVDYSPANTSGFDLTPQERYIVDAHYAERAANEIRHFEPHMAFVEPSAGVRICRLSPGELNKPATVDFLHSAGVDTLAVFGTNLIRSPLLEAFAGRIVNLHLGLSPYYRGTATNFYPLLNEEPEFVGATVHLIDAGIDSGPILAHARPEIVADDRPHSIGCKAILAGVSMLASVMPLWDARYVDPVPQWRPPNARLYLRKDFHPRHVVDLARKVEGGLIERYVAEAPLRKHRVRLVEPFGPGCVKHSPELLAGAG